MKNIKIWVDRKKPPEIGWIHANDFSSFSNLIHTVKLTNIDVISFGTELEEDELLGTDTLTAADCALELVDQARGKELPYCFNHTYNTELRNTINHYNKSYKYDKYCGHIA